MLSSAVHDEREGGSAKIPSLRFHLLLCPSAPTSRLASTSLAGCSSTFPQAGDNCSSVVRLSDSARGSSSPLRKPDVDAERWTLTVAPLASATRPRAAW